MRFFIFIWCSTRAFARYSCKSSASCIKPYLVERADGSIFHCEILFSQDESLIRIPGSCFAACFFIPVFRLCFCRASGIQAATAGLLSFSEQFISMTWLSNRLYRYLLFYHTLHSKQLFTKKQKLVGHILNPGL